MGRPPAHLNNGLSQRDLIWQAIRRLKKFDLAKLLAKAGPGVSLSTVREYVCALSKAGYVAMQQTQPAPKKAKQNGPVYTYTLLKDRPLAPKLRKDGTPIKENLGHMQVWQTARILKEFSVKDLIVQGGVSLGEHHTRYFCKWLAKAGYLQALPVNPPRYRFIPAKYSGPLPPVYQRTLKQVYDPNLKKVVWPKPENPAGVPQRFAARGGEGGEA